MAGAALIIAGAVLALTHNYTLPTVRPAPALVVASVLLALTHADSLPTFRIDCASHCLGQRRVTRRLGCEREHESECRRSCGCCDGRWRRLEREL